MGGRSVSTDNAYVPQDKVSISTDVTGRVIAVNVGESQQVHRGDVLFTIDPEPFRIALEQAQANLASARAQVAGMRQTFAGKGADVTGKREAIGYAEIDLKRQQDLMKDGFTTRARLEQAEHTLAQARSDYDSAQSPPRPMPRAALAGSPSAPIDRQPVVLAAQAARRQGRARPAADDGARAGRRHRQPDRPRSSRARSSPSGIPTMSLVVGDTATGSRPISRKPTSTTCASASRRRSSSTPIPARRVTAMSQSIGARTGSEFSVLPAQNATGNWVKVVQRVPVRIAIDDHRGRAADRRTLSDGDGRPAARMLTSGHRVAAVAGRAAGADGASPLAASPASSCWRSFITVLDSTIANVALPAHAGEPRRGVRHGDMGADVSYIVAAAIATPLTGWLGGKVGRKRLFLLAIAGFVGASMLCGLAQSLEQMVVFRLLQGASGAFIVPLGQSFLLDAYPKEKHGQAMALWGVGIMVGPVMGPVLGGWLTDNFRLALGVLRQPAVRPAGAVRRAGCAAVGRHRCGASSTPFGFVALGIGIGALQLMLDRGQQLDWFSQRGRCGSRRRSASPGCGCSASTSPPRATRSSPAALLRDRNIVTGFGFIFTRRHAAGGDQRAAAADARAALQLSGRHRRLAMAPRGIGTMVGMLLVGRHHRQGRCRAC